MNTPILIPFKVAILSTNTNSFGLRHAICIARNGDAFEAYPSAYGSNPPKQGDIVNVEAVTESWGYDYNLSSTGWEMGRVIEDAPPEVVDEVWKDQQATN